MPKEYIGNTVEIYHKFKHITTHRGNVPLFIIKNTAQTSGSITRIQIQNGWYIP